MSRYYVNKNAQNNGDHEVHTTGCSYMPKEENKISLGICQNYQEAVRKAKDHYSQSNGCYYCCNACHTS